MQLRLPLRRQGDRLTAPARHSDHVVAEVLDDRLEIHGDDRLVLDDQDARGELMREIAGAAFEQGDETRGIDAHDRGRLALREALDGRQQKRLPDMRRQGGEVPIERRPLGRVGEASRIGCDQTPR